MYTYIHIYIYIYIYTHISGRGLEIDRAPKHSDFNITTLHRNALFQAREWGGALEGPWEGGSGAGAGN